MVLAGLLYLNPFLAYGDFCRLLIPFANSLDPDQDQKLILKKLADNIKT